jgi:hypothetical protein
MSPQINSFLLIKVAREVAFGRISSCSRKSMALKQQASVPQLPFLALALQIFNWKAPTALLEQVKMVLHADDPRTTHTF